MVTHLLGITGAITLIILCTLLPFLPGPYDPLAAPLSWLARVFGFIGLLLVPVGALWTASHYSQRFARKQYLFALAALLVSSIVWGALSLAALALAGPSLAISIALLGAFTILRVKPRIRAFKSALPGSARAPALYLLIVPLAVFGLQQALVGPAVEFSRNHTIQDAAQLIADIESHRVARGAYPASLLSVWKDYKPSIIGIEKFHYEPSGAAYNLVFEQTAASFGTREFVVYNPLDQQVMTSHAMDLLQETPERLERVRGYYAAHAAPQPHWKYFWFD